MSYSRASRSDLDDRDYPSRSRPRVAVREHDDDLDSRVRDRERDRVPSFMREDNRRPEAGALVLSRREVETVDRRRPRSPSPQAQTFIRERYVERPRSLSPPPRPLSVTARPRYVVPDRSPSPPPQRDLRVDVDSRVVERRRPRSPTPEPDRERIRIMMEREKRPSPSPSPSPPPPPAPPAVIKGPTIEREVITHYRDIDHGMIRARSPTPPPPPPAPRTREQCETDIDIRHGRGETDIDITHTHSRSRSRPRPRPQSVYEEDLLMVRDRETGSRRRAHSEVRRNDWDEEAEYITSKIDNRGRMGEAHHGATRDWTIIDVPPGTERVKMDGVGGGGAEVTWQRYNGVRRSKFLPESDGGATLNSPSASEPALPLADRERDRLSVQIYDSDRDRSRDRGRDREVEEIHDRRISIRESSRPATKRKEKEMWTEITKDLVCREAIEKHGYNYEETDDFFYVMEYLRYEDVVELVNASEKIRHAARRRRRELDWERDYRDSRDRDRKSHHHHFHYDHEHSGSSSRRSLVWDKVDDERIVEREVVYDRAPRYLR